MTVAFRADADVTNATAGTSVVVDKPSGTADGDLLVALLGETGTGSITPPAGWTLVDSEAAGSDVTVAAYWKVAASEGASWTWTLGASVRNWGWVGAYTGVDTSDPIYESGAANTTSSATEAPAAVAEMHVGGLGLHGVAGVRTAGGSATTWTTTSTERADLSTNAGAGTDIAGCVGDTVNPRPHPQGGPEPGYIPTVTASQAQSSMAVVIVSLRPAFVAYDPASPLQAVVELALGADPDGDPDEWTYTDVSAYVLDTDDHPGITITKGRVDETGRAAPARASLALLNTDGRFTPGLPTGANYPNIVRNVPLRISLPLGFFPPTERCTHFVDSWMPRWDTSLNRPVVVVEASGRLRRIAGEVLRSPLYRSMSGVGYYVDRVVPAVYWPCEDESDATTIASGLDDSAAMIVSGTFTPAADSTLAGSLPLPTLGNPATLRGSVPGYTATGNWVAVFVVKVPASPSADTTLFEVTTTGTARTWRAFIDAGSPDALALEALDSSGTQILLTSVAMTEAEVYGTWHMIQMGVEQDGADIDYILFGSTPTTGFGVSGTLAGYTHGNATSIVTRSSAGLDGASVGHYAVYTAAGIGKHLPLLDVAMDGHTGETPAARFLRILGEEEVPFNLSGLGLQETAVLMGPQPPSTLVDILGEIEDTDQGFVHDGDVNTGFGDIAAVAMQQRVARYHATPSLTLDFAAGEVATFEPKLDTQGLRNHVTVSRSGGSEFTATDAGHIAVEGLFREAITLSLHDDTQLANVASWRVHRGTAPGMRYPRVAFDLRRNPHLAEEWLYAPVGSLLRIQNPPAGHAPDDIDQIMEGWTETIRTFGWRVAANCSPASPFAVAVLDSDTLGKLDTAGSVLAEAVDDDDTVFDVATTSGPLWTTDDTEDGFDINVGGERMTVTDIAATVVTSHAGGTAAHAVNDVVTPAIPSHAAGQLLLCLAAIRNSGTGVPSSCVGTAAWTRLPVFDATDNVQLFGRIAASAAETDPTVTFTGGVAGADTSAQVIRVGSGSLARWHSLDNIVVASASRLNASAQDITYPGLVVPADDCIVIYIGWKQDDWTSVATIAGATEIGEPDTTGGGDQGIVWDRVIQTTAANIPSGVFTVTGGASAISRGAVVAIRCDVQQFTVTRSANGVTKSHAAGAPVTLWQPAVLAL